MLHLLLKMCRQWPKIASTRRGRVQPINLVGSQKLADVEPIVEGTIKGQRIGKAYVDGGAQICVMSDCMMNQLGLEVSGPSIYKAKLANNVIVKCIGVMHDVKVKVCGVEVASNMYVMPSKGEGYPIILGRPWLIAM